MTARTRTLTPEDVANMVASLQAGRATAMAEKEPGAQRAFMLGYVRATLQQVVRDLAGDEAAALVEAAMVLP